MTFKIHSNNKLKVTKGSVLLFFQFAIPPPGSGSALGIQNTGYTVQIYFKRIEKNLYLFGISLHFFSFYLNIFSPGTLSDPNPQAWLFCMLMKVYFSNQAAPVGSSARGRSTVCDHPSVRGRAGHPPDQGLSTTVVKNRSSASSTITSSMSS